MRPPAIRIQRPPARACTTTRRRALPGPGMRTPKRNRSPFASRRRGRSRRRGIARARRVSWRSSAALGVRPVRDADLAARTRGDPDGERAARVGRRGGQHPLGALREARSRGDAHAGAADRRPGAVGQPAGDDGRPVAAGGKTRAAAPEVSVQDRAGRARDGAEVVDADRARRARPVRVRARRVVRHAGAHSVRSLAEVGRGGRELEVGGFGAGAGAQPQCDGARERAVGHARGERVAVQVEAHRADAGAAVGGRDLQRLRATPRAGCEERPAELGRWRSRSRAASAPRAAGGCARPAPGRSAAGASRRAARSASGRPCPPSARGGGRRGRCAASGAGRPRA